MSMETIEELKRVTDVPVVIAGQNGLILEVNPRFEAVFGWGMREIVGKPLTTIIPEHLHDSHHLGFSRFLMTGTPTLLNRPLKLKGISKDGREFDAEHVIIAEKRRGQWMFGATIRPLEGP